MLKLRGIHWALPDAGEILKGVDLDVPEGKLTVVTGPNGGGKTSLAKIIAGLYAPSRGEIIFNGENITKWDITRRAKGGIAYAFQQPVCFKGITVKDLMELSAEQKMDDDDVCAVLSRVGLCAREYINRDVNSALSGGESKRIEIATVLMRKHAQILVFDEPEAGIDLWSFNNLVETFSSLKAEGKRSVMVISHQERIMEIADYIVVVADGRVRLSGERSQALPKLLSDEKNTCCPLCKSHEEAR
ncbi:MAG: ATP-binding cassette domain-containing protein [Clostridia bacterium]|nr:ATP-binding cassette domain-containing protein [Clostridia bacterium]